MGVPLWHDRSSPLILESRLPSRKNTASKNMQHMKSETWHSMHSKFLGCTVLFQVEFASLNIVAFPRLSQRCVVDHGGVNFCVDCCCQFAVEFPLYAVILESSATGAVAKLLGVVVLGVQVSQ